MDEPPEDDLGALLHDTRLVLTAFHRLSFEQRLVMTCSSDKLPIEAIAAIMGMTTTQTRDLLAKARTALRRDLAALRRQEASE